nr:manganese efflux pump [Bacillus subtilis]
MGFKCLYTLLNSQKNDSCHGRAFSLLLFAIGVSLDSFSVGLSLGIYGSHPFLTITLFGLFSMMLTWLGLLVGKQVQSWLGTYSEALGGIILIVFGLKLLLPI